MSRVERVTHLLQSIEYEMRTAFDEHTELMNRNQALEAEDAKLRNLALDMYDTMGKVLDYATDTVWCDQIGTLRDNMDHHMQVMADLGIPPSDYDQRCKELGIYQYPGQTKIEVTQ